MNHMATIPTIVVMEPVIRILNGETSNNMCEPYPAIPKISATGTVLANTFFK